MLRLWDLETGKALQSCEGHARPIAAMAFGPEGKFLSGGWDGRIKMWSADKFGSLRTFGQHPDWVLALAASPDGKMVATGTADQSIRLWNPKTGGVGGLVPPLAVAVLGVTSAGSVCL